MLIKRLIFIGAFWPTLTLAGFEEGLTAFDAWDMENAAQEYGTVAATNGRAAFALAQMYRRRYFGDPNEQDRKYIDYLELAAKLGDAEAKGTLGDKLVGGIALWDRATSLNAIDANRGLVLLRESCDQKFPLACGSLARINYDGLQIGDLKIAVNAEEAKRYGDLWKREALAQSGNAWYRALSGFLGPKGASGIVDDITQASFRIVLNRRVGVTDEQSRYELISGRKYTAADVSTAMAQADLLEKAQGINEGQLPDPRVMARRITTYYAAAEQITDQDLSQIARAIATNQVANQRGSGLLQQEGWDPLFKKIFDKAATLIKPYYEKRLKLLIEKKLDARSWLTEKLATSVDAHALRFVDRFLDSDAGKRFLRFEAALRKTGTESSILAQRLTYDPAMERLGSTPQQRWLKYAESKNIRLVVDQSNMAERDRANFMRNQLSRLTGFRSLGANMISSELAPLAGPAYVEIERMFSPQEISIIEAITFRPGNTHWQTVVNRVTELEVLRSKDADIQTLEKEFAEKIVALEP